MFIYYNIYVGKNVNVHHSKTRKSTIIPLLHYSTPEALKKLIQLPIKYICIISYIKVIKTSKEKYFLKITGKAGCIEA